MSDEPQAWIEVDGRQYPVRQVWVIPGSAEFLTLDDDDNPVFWAGDHLETGTRIF